MQIAFGVGGFSFIQTPCEYASNWNFKETQSFLFFF